MKSDIRFGGDFELDLHACQLRRSGRVLKLERIPMEVLLLLVEQPGQLVRREQIVEKVWGRGVFLDTDNSINGAIRKIRQVLKDNPDHPRFIQTIPGKGYRFIAPVTDAEAETQMASPSKPSLDVAVPPQVTVEAPSIRAPAWRRRRRVALLTAALGLIVGWAAWFQWTRPRLPAPPKASEKLMLAILPFENLTGDPTQDYFSDGLTEDMISYLGNLDPQRLGVIARTSVMRYKQSRMPLDGIGRELGVQYVLEGSVRRDADNVRITAQLIQVSDQTHLWARRYDRELSSLIALQAEIAQAVADEIHITLARNKLIESVRPPALSPAAYEAYDLYLKGRYFLNKRNPQGLRQALEYFQEAAAREPSYARAYAGLADAYTVASSYSLAPKSESLPNARAAALKAVELDESLAEAHTALALIALSYDFDWMTAEKAYRRAIQLDPNYATAHHWYAELLAYQGRFDEAFAEIERARQLDPLSLIVASDRAEILYLSRDYDRAVAQVRTVLDMDPHFPQAHFLLVFSYAQKGMFAEALSDIEKWRHWDETPWTLLMQAYVYGRSGEQAQARRTLEKLEQLNRRRQMDPAVILVAQVGMGNTEAAFAWFEKAYRERSAALSSVKVNPIYDPLRSDPRFAEVLRRMNFPE